jgi:two-component system sensor histidine kinase RstB
MTWLFARFYLCVLLVLALAWYLHGVVLRQRAEADTSRVVLTAHGGGARLVAAELDAARPEAREEVLKALRKGFAYPVEMITLSDLPGCVQREIRNGAELACFRLGRRHCIVAVLSGGLEVVRLGPFPDYSLPEVEASIGGWMRLTARKLDTTTPEQRPTVLQELQKRFDFPLELVRREDLPDWPQGRIDRGETVAFYPQNPPSEERWLAATPLADGATVVCFGPFPSFESTERPAAATTLALVLLPVALAIALLLRPVARQLRHVEHAAQAIAAGDLTARVDERRVRSATSLAQAFNQMAGRTEALVRTQRELLQAVSHELRTPLSRIRFAAELIATAPDDAQRKQRLQSLDAATEELDELVGELLRYVRLETTEPTLDLEQISLRDELGILIPKHAALHPTVQFDVDKSVGDEQVLVAERAGLHRAIGNLLSNAGRFAKSRVSINAILTVDGATIIDVDDDGEGIPEAERERVFEPFVRLPDSVPGSGVGLGLALVKRIVTQHGGSVQALTSPWGGCRMRTTWPAQASAPEGRRPA